jgi:ribosomal protein S12 methylthiotransferase accessory factor
MTATIGRELDVETLRTAYPLASLVRPRVGLVDGCTLLFQEPGVPLFELATAELDNLTRTFSHVTGAGGRDVSDKIIGGAGVDFDPKIAWVKAVAEAAERYATMVFDAGDFLEASGCTLGRRGIDLDRIPRCSEREYRDSRCPLRPPNSREAIRWVRGYSLTHRCERLVPAVMTHLYCAPRPEERFWIPISTGVAAHTDPVQAMVSALCEVIERDAIALTWLTQRPLPSIAVPSCVGQPLRRLLDALDGTRVRYLFFDATTDLGVPTIFSVQLAPNDPSCQLAVSCASAPDAETALSRAILEAATTRAALVAAGSPPADIAEFSDIVHGAAYYARGNGRDHFDFLLRSEHRTTLTSIAAAAPNSTSPAGALRALVSRLGALDMEAIAVDLTTDELRDVGLWVVRVIVPELVPISFVHRARFLGTRRIYETWRHSGPLPPHEDHVNPGPLPFA